jgi:L-ascorbate metabolism protein UlaG (beta-lactamase superfamily)
VILLDAYYDRGPRNRPIGITAAAVTHADAILIGHGHFDHVSDAAVIARKTGAPVIGAEQSIGFLRSLGVPARQLRFVTGRGGEVLRFKGFTVEPILARHSILAGPVVAKFREAIAAVLGPPSDAEREAEIAIRARQSGDTTLETAGTLAYLFTFANEFRLIFLDTAGPITAEERALMKRIGQTDVAIVAYQGQYLARAQIANTLPLIKLFNPAIYLPSHHDEIAGLFPDLGIEPLFMALRDEMPQTSTIAPLYRSPICLELNGGSSDVRPRVQND